MGVQFRYVPPKIDARVVVAAAASAAVEAGAELIYKASQPLVPVETGTLKESGKVQMTGPHQARVSYDAVSEDGYPYGIRQHEDATLNHPNGGEDHFLSKPFATEGDAVLEAMAVSLRKAL